MAGNPSLQIKVHRLIPLYSHFQLPIIVAMKIWFRTDAKGSGGQSPQNPCIVELSFPLPSCPRPTPAALIAAPNRQFPRDGYTSANRLSQGEFGGENGLLDNISTR